MLRIFLFIGVFACFEVHAQEDFQQVVAQALRFQVQSDSLRRLVEKNTEALENAPQSSIMGIMISIRDNDARAVELQKLADGQFQKLADMSLEKNALFVEVTESRIMPVEPKFAILPRSPYSASNPVPFDVPLPDGVVYKIQLGAFSRTMPANNFRGLSPVSGERLENGVTKYYVGVFNRFADADDALRKVQEYGFRDAFIVAFHNRRTISTERARQLEVGSR